MEKIKSIIEEKYYWMPQYRITLDWAEKALDEGMDVIDVVSFITKTIFAKAA